jgi:amino acid transporter
VAVATAAGLTPISTLGMLVNIGTLLAFVIVSIGVIVLRRTRPDLPRPFRMPLVPALPALSAAVALVLMLGLPRAVSAKLIIQSAVGAATMLAETGEHPVILREAVTSPAGTTIMAIRELEKHGVRAALLAAIEAARDRSQELGRAHKLD